MGIKRGRTPFFCCLIGGTRGDGKGVVCFHFFENLQNFQKNENKPFEKFTSF